MPVIWKKANWLWNLGNGRANVLILLLNDRITVPSQSPCFICSLSDKSAKSNKILESALNYESEWWFFQSLSQRDMKPGAYLQDQDLIWVVDLVRGYNEEFNSQFTEKLFRAGMSRKLSKST